MKHNVPYYSQFLDIQDPFWMLRACGAVSLQMVLEFFGKDKRDLVEICKEALLKEGYHIENGWVHDYLVSYAQSHGLCSYRKEQVEDVSEIANHLQKYGPVIVSVEKRVLEQKRFHIIVLTGYELDETGIVTHFYYHEPESTNKEKGQYRKCDLNQFMNFWRGKAIFISSRTV